MWPYQLFKRGKQKRNRKKDNSSCQKKLFFLDLGCLGSSFFHIFLFPLFFYLPLGPVSSFSLTVFGKSVGSPSQGKKTSSFLSDLSCILILLIYPDRFHVSFFPFCPFCWPPLRSYVPHTEYKTPSEPQNTSQNTPQIPLQNRNTEKISNYIRNWVIFCIFFVFFLYFGFGEGSGVYFGVYLGVRRGLVFCIGGVRSQGHPSSLFLSFS